MAAMQLKRESNAALLSHASVTYLTKPHSPSLCACRADIYTADPFIQQTPILSVVVRQISQWYQLSMEDVGLLSTEPFIHSGETTRSIGRRVSLCVRISIELRSTQLGGDGGDLGYKEANTTHSTVQLYLEAAVAGIKVFFL